MKSVIGSNTTVYVGAIYEKMTSGGSTAGKGFIKRFGLTRGALAGAVAHDHHNLVVIGADDHSMMTAARA
ncbi:MAG: adenine deaminase C-terminal domain-containing protein, partial [Anaerolineae bacterium]